MNDFSQFLKDFFSNQIVSSIIVVILSFTFYKFLTHFLFKRRDRSKFKLNIGPRSTTYLRLGYSIIRYVFIAVTVLIVLQINHVEVSSLLAGIGIAGTIFGLAVQDTLKDIIRGTTIISDNYFSVGDTIKYKDIEGKVIIIGLKSTKIEDIKTGEVFSIANRGIEEASVLPKYFYFDVPLPYELPYDQAMKALTEACQAATKSDLITDAKPVGASKLDDSAIAYKCQVFCDPSQKYPVHRAFHAAVLATLAKHHIDIPYNQLDIHTK